MTSNSLEPSFADAVNVISAAADLPLQTRRQWCSALRGIARCFDQPLEAIPARFSAVRARMAALHHVPADWTPKTLANTRSNAKAALLWFTKEQKLPSAGISLSPAWDRLHRQLDDPSTRYRLSPFMRFCSGSGIEPSAVDEVVLDRYLIHRENTTARTSNASTRRIIARLWNKCISAIEGWPHTRLFEPPVMTKEGPAWTDFPVGLQNDTKQHLADLGRMRRTKNGFRPGACKVSTIEMRRREIVAAARTAVKSGVPIESLTSLSALLQPEVATAILDSYWKQNGPVPSTYTINLGGRLFSIAQQIGCFDETALEKLGDLRYALEQHREEGMTEKNLAVVRMALTPGVWDRVVNLPKKLLQQARAQRRHAPIRAGVLAQIAVAVGILTVAPVRLGNLTMIRLGENLIKPDGPDSNFWLQFPKYDVKNRRALQFKLAEEITGIINEYVHDFRPALLRGRIEDWLFPGISGDHKEKISFGTQIVERIQKTIGLRVTCHQFRHAAAALILKHRPGEFELVRCLLGHRTVETTRRFYIDLETVAANEIYSDIVYRRLKSDDEAA
jgi:hypothetical protein